MVPKAVLILSLRRHGFRAEAGLGAECSEWQLRATPDLLFLCCVRSQGEFCCNSVNSFAAVPQENRSFTRDIDLALHMARLLLCGTVSVNGFSKGDIKTPFGG